jgi:hypothetical protein
MRNAGTSFILTLDQATIAGARITAAVTTLVILVETEVTTDHMYRYIELVIEPLSRFGAFTAIWKAGRRCG